MSTSVMTADTIIYTTVRFKVEPGLSTDQATVEMNLPTLTESLPNGYGVCSGDLSILDVPEILEITFKKQRIIPAALGTWLRTQLKAVSTQAGFDEAEERRINGPCSPNARMQRDFLLRLNRGIVLGKTVHPQSVEQWFEKTYQEEKLRAHEGTEGWGGHQYEGDWSPELEILRQMGSDLFGLTSDELR